MKIRNVIVISDIHAGCKLGLFDPTVEVQLAEGGLYYPSESQLAVYAFWERSFWGSWVPKVTKNEPYIVVINGDAMDGRHHYATTPITHNLAIQRRIAEGVLASKTKDNPMCKATFYIKGTEAHSGPSAEQEENLAEALECIPEDSTGQYARWEMWLRMANGALIHFSHHIGTTGTSAYESTAPMKEMIEAFNEAGRWKDEPPDVVVRSHRHRGMHIVIPTDKGMGMSVITPGWQLKTPYVYRTPTGRSGTPHIGGYLLRCGDEEYVYARFQIGKVKRSKEVKLDDIKG